MKNQAQNQIYQENQFDENDYNSDFTNDNPDEYYEYDPRRNQEYLKQNINEFRFNMGLEQNKKNQLSFRKVFLVALACLIIPPTAFFMGHSLRQGLPERNIPEPPQIITQPYPAAEEPFCVLDNEMKEGYLSPEDFVLLKDGETQYSISAKNEFMINQADDFHFVSSYDRDRSSYSTQKGIKIGDDLEDFLNLYSDYKTDYISYETEDGETMIKNNITVKEFKENYIDTGKVDLNDPSLDIYFLFSLHSDGEHIIEMIDDGHYHKYDRHLEISFRFDSNDKLGNNERAENNSSTGQHLDYIDTNYYHF